MPYTVNSCALTGEKPCINKGFLVPLKHRKLTFNMIVPGPLKLFRHTLFNCHNTINWWCNRPIQMDPLKKKEKKKKKKKKRRCWARFWTLFFWVRVRYCIHHAREPLVLQRGTIASYTYHYYTSIDKLRHQSLYTSSCRQTELKTMLSSYVYDVEMRVKQLWKKNIARFLLPRTAGWHRNRLCLFIMEIIACKGRPFSVFVDGFVSHFALLQLYSHHLVLSFSKYRGRIEWWQPSWISWCARTRKTDI